MYSTISGSTFATRVAQAGNDPAAPAAIRGHSSIRTVQRYVHPTADHKRSAMARYDEILKATGGKRADAEPRARNLVRFLSALRTKSGIGPNWWAFSQIQQKEKNGGARRNRTADKGFADLCLTTWRPRPHAGRVFSFAKRPGITPRNAKPTGQDVGGGQSANLRLIFYTPGSSPPEDTQTRHLRQLQVSGARWIEYDMAAVYDRIAQTSNPDIRTATSKS